MRDFALPERLTEPRRTTRLISHKRQHPDEIAGGKWMASKRPDLLPGIETARRQFWDAGTTKTPDGRPIADWEKDSWIVGTGGGSMDEHVLPKNLRSQHCAATLAARRLGFDKDPAMKPILEALLRNDRKGHRSVWDAPSAVWALHLDGVPELEVEAFFCEWLDAAYAASQKKVAGQPLPRPVGRPDLNGYIRMFVIQEYGYNITDERQLEHARIAPSAYDAALHLGVAGWDEVGQLLKLEDRKHVFGAATLFDIHTYVEHMHAAGHPEEHVRERVFQLLTSKRNEQRMFMAAFDDVHPNRDTLLRNRGQEPEGSHPVRFFQLWKGLDGKITEISCSGPERAGILETWRIKRNARLLREVAEVWSDNPLAHKAVRNAYKTTLTLPAREGDPADAKPRKVELMPDIIVLMKPKGHVAIFFSEVPARPMVKAIRKMEYFAGPGRNVPIDDGRFLEPYNIPEEPCWCWFEEANQLLNGSLTAPGVPPTRVRHRIVPRIMGILKYIAEETWKKPAPQGAKPQEKGDDRGRRNDRNRDRQRGRDRNERREGPAAAGGPQGPRAYRHGRGVRQGRREQRHRGPGHPRARAHPRAPGARRGARGPRRRHGDGGGPGGPADRRGARADPHAQAPRPQGRSPRQAAAGQEARRAQAHQVRLVQR